jgi:hypothetical protein
MCPNLNSQSAFENSAKLASLAIGAPASGTARWEIHQFEPCRRPAFRVLQSFFETVLNCLAALTGLKPGVNEVALLIYARLQGIKRKIKIRTPAQFPGDWRTPFFRWNYSFVFSRGGSSMSQES